jgi:hypothetical protein
MPGSFPAERPSDLQAAQDEADIREGRLIEIDNLIAVAKGLREIAEIKFKQARAKVDVFGGDGKA